MSFDLRPSELRQRILSQHREIEAMLDSLEAGAERLGQSSSEDPRWIRVAAEALGQVLEWHMNLEERQLVPLLRDTDAFGPIRAERLADEHARQRVELTTLLDRVEAAADTHELVRRTHALVEAIRADIAYEDAEYLGEGLLRDDTIVTDGAFGG